MSNKPSYVVGIGGSSGSMDELFTIFNAQLPKGCSFIVAQALPADFKARLFSVGLLHCVEIKSGMYLRKNTMYLLPDNQSVTIFKGQLNLAPAGSGEHGVIDTFFCSLAIEFGSKAIALVLAGEGADGSIGIKVVKTNGGSVLARNPMTTGFSHMPASAIATGVVDSILEPAEMSGALHRLTHTAVAA